MDVNWIRIAVMLLAFGGFLGIVWWAYGPSRKSRFERVGRSVFDDDASDAAARTEVTRGAGSRKGN